MSAARRPKVTIYETGDGWRWRLRAKNGKIQDISSEAYATKWNAERALRQVRTAYLEADVEVFEDYIEVWG
jgi:uncharacterized protein YegP (UPF0339 family)